MAQQVARPTPFAEYLGHFDGLISDKRTGEAFGEIVRGIINAGSLVCQRIAAHSPLLSAAKDGAQRVIRLAKGESTKRSDLDATHFGLFHRLSPTLFRWGDIRLRPAHGFSMLRHRHL